MLLITGGGGFIGSHVALQALTDNIEIIVLDNFSNGSREALSRVQQLAGKKIIIFEGSITDARKLRTIFSSYPVSGVIHLAGLKSVAESTLKPIEYYRTNVAGTLTLVQEMIQAGVKNMIFSSSATVYGEPVKLPITEEHPIGGTSNPYGTTKYLAERFLMDICASDRNFCVTSLRYFNPIGAHSSGQIGESPSSAPENIMPYLTQVAVGQRDFLRVFGSDYETIDGSGVRDYLHVCDLARAHVMAIENNHNGYSAVNLGTGEGFSVLQLVHAFERVTGVAIAFEVEGRRAGDIAECYADNSKAAEVLGWVPELSLDDMLRDAWRWQSKNPSGYLTDEIGI